MQAQINTYHIWYFVGNTEAEAVIECNLSNNKVGKIHFMKDGLPIPPNAIGPNGMNFYYSRDHFNNISTILRHEAPIQMSLSRNGEGWLTTTDREPVGESE